MISCFTLTLAILTGHQAVSADEWPAYRKDNHRSGIAAEQPELPLSRVWVFKARFPPRPAYEHGYPKPTNWEGGVEKNRIDFDRSDGVVAVGGRAYFGSVGDGKLYCLKSKSGKVDWTFATAGPIRLAPTVSRGSVYVGSDDGYVYCLDATSGKLRWKFRAAPEDHKVVGNGSMVSLWPVRTGVLVEDGIAYFGAGIFPTEGVYLYAVGAKRGNLIWRNDRGGQKRLEQISPQGYLLAEGDRLVVPMARLAPGIYDRSSGKMLVKLSIYYGGGTFGVLSGSHLFTGWEDVYCFDIRDLKGQQHGTTNHLGRLPGGRMVYRDGVFYTCAVPHGAGKSKSVQGIKWQPLITKDETDKDKRRGKPANKPEKMWSTPFDSPESIILAGKTLIVGGKDKVAALNSTDGVVQWSDNVEGNVTYLAFSDGRLYASTDTGQILCYGKAGTKTIGEVGQPISEPKPSDSARAAAKKILELAPVNQKGFALIYGIETGELALELARRTEMKICAVSNDIKKVERARRLLDDAGIYGGRVTVEHCPQDRAPFTKYFANLVVSETPLFSDKLYGDASEAFRVTAPVRGTVIIGRPDNRRDRSVSSATLGEWSKGSPLADSQTIEQDGIWSVYTRPPLQGSRPWTNQYGGPGATGSSEDELVRAPFRVQWFGEPGPQHFVDRHYWAAAPLAGNGRIFVCSYRGISAFDVYNGTKLWNHPLENATRAHVVDVPSNTVLSDDGYFVAVDDVCYRIDPATGQLLGQFEVPKAADGKRRMWGYIGVMDGMLIGSRTLGYLPMNEWRKRKIPYAHFLCSDRLFGIRLKDGKTAWSYETPWFRHNSVVLGKDAAFLSHPGGTKDQVREAIGETKPIIEKYSEETRQKLAELLKKPYTELLSAIDIESGKPDWQRVVDWTVCGGQRGTLIYKDGLLLQLSDIGGDKSYYGYKGGKLIGRSIAVRNAESGEMVWMKPLDYRGRAVVVGDTIYAEPWACDLRSGKKKLVTHPVTGEKTPWFFVRPHKNCGPINASKHTLFFRSGSIGYYDVQRDEGTSHFDSNRPSCWMSFISAEGLALWPTGDSGCRCNYAIQCSVALVHDVRSRVYGDYSSSLKKLTPVKHLALNLGAPGDRRDKENRLWLAYPRRKFYLGMEFQITAELYDGGAYSTGDSIGKRIGGTTTPWVYHSSASGIKSLTIPVLSEGDSSRAYTVELLMSAAEGDRAGQRVFDLKLQGRTVARGVDVMKASGLHTAHVLRYENIETPDSIKIELVSKQENPKLGQWPNLSGVIVRSVR